mmetsp:Transcript_9545/g.19421  ORF Transcript_9545/g.19421 Transcript_9545/m.19421 type:complete len:146 (-) Transcript_9545:17-454(-)
MALFDAKIPKDLPVARDNGTGHPTITAYGALVIGWGTSGTRSLVGCFMALAAGGGNKWYWKPLIHAIIGACGHGDHAEVLNAGASALLFVLWTLGEECMVLLPECLPVLSELQEDDDDEDVVSLARECAQMGEDLLGESLESSLR